MEKDLKIIETLNISSFLIGNSSHIILYATTESVYDARYEKLSDKKLLDYWYKSAIYPYIRKFLYPYCKNLITKGENDQNQDVYIVEMECTVCGNIFREITDINEPPTSTVCPACMTNFGISDIEKADIVNTISINMYTE